MPDPNTLGPDGFPRSGWTPPDTGVQLAPGGEGVARAAGYAPPPPPVAAPGPVPTAAPAPRPAEPFIPDPLPPSPHGAASRKAVALAYPFTLDGRAWDAIHVRRFTAGQVATVVRNHIRERQGDPEAALAFPSFVDADGAEVPEAVMAAVDDDDMTTLQEAARAFLPRRFRPDPGPTTDASGQEIGASTSA